MADKQLLDGFIPLWKEDIDIIKNLSYSAFIVLITYRLHMDRTSAISSITDLDISKITGLCPKGIYNARGLLIKDKLIKNIGFHKHLISDFMRSKAGSGTSVRVTDPNDKAGSGTSVRVTDSSVRVTDSSVRVTEPTPPLYKIDRSSTVLQLTLSPILRQDIGLLFKQQGYKTEAALLNFFYQVAQERLNKGYREGVLRVALKRAVGLNSKAKIQDILSYEALDSIKKEQRQHINNSDLDKKIAGWKKETKFQGTNRKEAA